MVDRLTLRKTLTSLGSKSGDSCDGETVTYSLIVSSPVWPNRANKKRRAEGPLRDSLNTASVRSDSRIESQIQIVSSSSRFLLTLIVVLDASISMFISVALGIVLLDWERVVEKPSAGQGYLRSRVFSRLPQS